MVDVPHQEEAIYQAIRKCGTDAEFQRQCRTCENPYGAGNAGPRIAEVLATIPMNEDLLRKKMTY